MSFFSFFIFSCSSRFRDSSAPNPTCKPVPKPAQALTIRTEGNEQNHEITTFVILEIHMYFSVHENNNSSSVNKFNSQKNGKLYPFFLFPGETASELKPRVTSSTIWTVVFVPVMLITTFMSSMMFTAFTFFTSLYFLITVAVMVAIANVDISAPKTASSVPRGYLCVSSEAIFSFSVTFHDFKMGGRTASDDI